MSPGAPVTLPEAPGEGWPWEPAGVGAVRGEAAGDGPLVSVVTPSFNQVRFLEATVRSVLLQDYPGIEYMVLDGGSDDGSVDILRKYETWLASWVSEPDDGQTAAINKGFRAARGEILAYLNSDDLYEPGAVSAAVHVFEQNPDADLVYGAYRYVDEGGAELRSFTPPDFSATGLLLGNYISQPTVFIRRRAMESLGPFKEQFHYAMDYDYWLRAAAAGFRFARCDRVQACMRMHARAKTTALEHCFQAEVLAAFDALFGGEVGPQMVAVRGRAYARCHWLAAVSFGFSGERAEARRHAHLALEEFGLRDEPADVGFAVRFGVRDRYGALRRRRQVMRCCSSLGGHAAQLVAEGYEQELRKDLSSLRRPQALGRLLREVVGAPCAVGQWAFRRLAMDVLRGRVWG